METITQALNSKHIASYGTEKALLEAIESIQASDHRHVVVQRKDGRWTAIFAFSNLQGGGKPEDQGNLFRYKVTKKTAFMIFG